MFKKVVSVAVIVSFNSMMMGGCATKGGDISAAYVPASIYSNLGCPEIAQELMDVGLKASELSGQLDSAAGKDAGLVAVGVILFWPALFFVGGDKNKEAQLAQLKGQRDSLLKAAKAKGCNLDDLKPVINKEMASSTPAASPAPVAPASAAQAPGAPALVPVTSGPSK